MPDTNDPILEQIAQTLLDGLNGIKSAAGYQNDVVAERPNPKLANRRRDCLCVLVQDASERVEDEADFFHLHWLQSFTVFVHVVESENSSVPIDKRLNSLIADVIEKLIELGEQNVGGNARDLDVGAPVLEPIPDTLVANQGGAGIPFTVYFSHARNDPRKRVYEA